MHMTSNVFLWFASVQLGQTHRPKLSPLIFAHGVGDAGRMDTVINMQVSCCVHYVFLHCVIL